MKLPTIKNKTKEKGYDYSEDIDRANCTHKRTKIFEVKPEWEIDTVSLIIACKGCTKIGTVDGTVNYYEEEVRWQI